MDKDTRSELLSILTFEELRVNWINPTGHWRLDLGHKGQRGVMMQIIAMNNKESENSRFVSKRADTSQNVSVVRIVSLLL